MNECLRSTNDRSSGDQLSNPTSMGVGYVECHSGQDKRELRNAMGRFATGVTVITTMVNGLPVGVTANSFTSVSLEPPLVLFCLGKGLGCLEAFQSAECFMINVLQSDQQSVSNAFATKGIDRFKDTAWHTSTTGLPVIDGALGSIECTRHTEVDAGDHTIFIGEVVRARYVPGHDPLLYFGGDYRQINQA